MRRALNNRLKRQQTKRQVIFIILGCIIVSLLVIVVFAITPSDSPEKGKEESVTAESPEQAEGEVAGVHVENALPLSLGLGGDVCFGLDVAQIMAAQGPAYPWMDIAPYLRDYDVTVVNLEGPLGHGGEPHPDQPSVHVRADASCVPPMAEAGVDAVFLANDHIMDYGSAGLEETLNILNAQGLKGCGAGSTARMARQPLAMGVESGASVALLSFCDVAPPAYAATEESPGLATADLACIGDAVTLAADEAPYVVAFFHWGMVGSREITGRQRELAHAAVQAGADLVVGCHPHLVQGLEVWQGVPIVYSLGSLVFSSQSEEGKYGIIAGCSFDQGRLTSLELVPLRLEMAKPQALSGAQAEQVLRELASSSPGVDLIIYPQTASAYLNL